MWRVVTFLLAGALCLAIGATMVVPRVYPTRETITGPMETIVPADKAGWRVHNRPITETEAMEKTVSNVLRYDSAVFRIYRRDALRVGIYAAHWRAGKVSLSHAGAHTPDTCWIVAGWNRTHRQHAARVAVDGRPLKPAEIGTFEKGGIVEHVMFWHLAGGRPITFDQFGWDASWPARLKRGVSFVSDLRRFGLDQRCDQAFVRVSCNRPIGEAFREPAFRELLRSLEPLGIFALPVH